MYSTVLLEHCLKIALFETKSVMTRSVQSGRNFSGKKGSPALSTASQRPFLHARIPTGLRSVNRVCPGVSMKTLICGNYPCISRVCKCYAAATLLQSHDPHAGNAPPVTLGTLGPHPAVSEGAWAPYAAGSTEQKPRVWGRVNRRGRRQGRPSSTLSE